MAWGEIARVPVGDDRQRVPRLDDVLAWARGRVAVNVEAKRDVPDRLAFARALARVLAAHPDVDVLVSSFDPMLLAAIATRVPRVPRAWLTHAGQERWTAAWAPVAARAPIHAVHLEWTQATPALVARLRAAGKCVGVWTVNDPREAQDLAARGVDWIVTDAPGAVRAAINRTPLR
jgi:glycerophosphoryl diester phosphodiesterase